jgi:hypothetical protein
MTNLLNNTKSIKLNTKLGQVEIAYFELDIKNYSDKGEKPFYIGHIQAVFKGDNPWSAMYFSDRNDEDWNNMTSFLKQIEDVTKEMVKVYVSDLKDADIHYSEQGMQGKNFMDMDIHFMTKPTKKHKWGHPDEEKQNRVFSKMVGEDSHQASIMFS